MFLTCKTRNLVVDLIMFLVLLLLISSAVISADTYITGAYERGHCLSLILVDGFVTNCFDEDRTLLIISGESLTRYEYYLILYYNQSTMRLKGLKHVSNDVITNSATLIENRALKMQLISPTPSLVITSDSIDFYYNIYNDEDNLLLRIVDLSAYTDEYESKLRVDQSDTFFNITMSKETLHHYSVSVGYTSPITSRITNLCAYFYHSQEFNVSDCITSVCFSINIPIHKYQYPKLLKNIEFDAHKLISAIHVLFYSTNSFERYDEAVVMLKSLLYHRDGTLNTPLIIHIVTDSNGAVYFEEIFKKYMKMDSVAFIIHDVSIVCKVPLAKFFRDTNTYMSHHHSGHVGYCRLFIYDYFKQYQSDSRHPLYSYIPQRIITVETDQLFVSSIDELWNYSGQDEGNDKILIAAAENYQPFLDSRADRHFRSIASANKAYRNEGDEYHGYGLIGGIMIFYLNHQHAINWTNYLPTSFLKYQKYYYNTYNITFNPQLNDQDILNSIIDLDPGIYQPLPCNYNIQLHARLNTYLQCYHHIFDSCQIAKDGSFSKCDYSDDHTVSMFLDKYEVYTNDVPSNCEKSRDKNIFLCEIKPAKVIHFMAKSYSTDSGLNYYKGFWQHYRDLPWSLV